MSTATESAPVTSEQLFSEIETNLQDVLNRPVIADHPELQSLILTYTKRYADTLLYMGEHNAEHTERWRALLKKEREDRKEQAAAGQTPPTGELGKTPEAKDELDEHGIIKARIRGNLGALTEEAIAEIKNTGLMSEYIEKFLNTPEEIAKSQRKRWDKGLDPQDPAHCKQAAERIVGSMIKCAVATVKAHYSQVWVDDYVDARDAYSYLQKLTADRLPPSVASEMSI